MKKIIVPLLITTNIWTTLSSFSSCAKPLFVDNFIEPLTLNKDVVSKNNIGCFAFRFKDYIDDNIQVSIIQNEQDPKLTLPKKTVNPIGKIVDLQVCFEKEQEKDSRVQFSLQFSFVQTKTKQKYYSIVNDLSITYGEESLLEFQCNNYAEANNKNFINNLTAAEHDYYEVYCSNFFCNSGAEACMNWGHHPGYPLWSEALHSGKGSTEMLDNENIAYTWFDYPGIQSYQRYTRYKDYKWLDEALKLSTVGNVGVPIYHGFEPDEKDLKDFVNETSQLDMDTDPIENWTEDVCKKFIGKHYIDWSWLATSFDFSYSYDWCIRCNSNTVPFLEIEVDPDVYGGYLSYSRRTWYGFYLSRPENYQLLLNRKATITVTAARIVKEWVEGVEKNVLYLNVKVSRQNI